MSTNSKSERPMYRLTFSRITGQDGEGRDILARPKEIGAVWARKGGKAGGIVSLDIIPVELAQRQGVLFLVPVGTSDDGGAD
jgi:hypothetical protein